MLRWMWMAKTFPFYLRVWNKSIIQCCRRVWSHVVRWLNGQFMCRPWEFNRAKVKNNNAKKRAKSAISFVPFDCHCCPMFIRETSFCDPFPCACIVLQIHNLFVTTVQIHLFSLIYSFNVRKLNTLEQNCRYVIYHCREVVEIVEKYAQPKLYWQWCMVRPAHAVAYACQMYYKSMPEYLPRQSYEKKSQNP